MNIRALTASDAETFHALRLRSLRDHPQAFGSAHADEINFPIEKIVERLQNTADRMTLGALVERELVGFVSFVRYVGQKTRHRAMLAAMYVMPERRGQQIGAALLDQVIDYARGLADLEEIILAVTVGNPSARRLYATAGFVASHIEARYIKLDEQYYDIEWMTLRLGSR
ncbi:MAG: GNAT family N-acetyltransferase [Chloroflexota bacterium]|nr:GNAT family N-acetyltransferase [Chloroflexota bacterium]